MKPASRHTPKAYSYLRFSSPEQAKGTSLERQIGETRKYCEEHQLVLDEQLRDEGVSGYRGKNRTEGALSGFLKKVEDGNIAAGSVLIIESLDRLSREAATEAQYLLLSLVRKGVEIVTLVDKQRYSKASIDAQPFQLMFALMISMRGHDESGTKEFRGNKRWAIHRKNAQDGVAKIKQVLPAWLKWKDNSRTEIVAIPDRVAVLREIFKLAAGGSGKFSIAKTLNARREQTWGTGKRKAAGWHTSYIQKLLTNRSVIGEFQPHRLTAGRNSQRIKVGDPIENYYPAVVERGVFATVQSKRQPGKPGRIGDTVANLFTSLVFCEGAPLQFENKGAHVYLATSRAWCGRVKRTAFPYHEIEEFILRGLREIDWDEVLEADKSDQQQTVLKKQRQELALFEQQEAEITKKLDRLTHAIEIGEGNSTTLVQRVSALEQERNKLREDAEIVSKLIADNERATSALKVEVGTLQTTLTKLNFPTKTRLLLRDQIARIITRIDLAQDSATITEVMDIKEVLDFSDVASEVSREGLFYYGGNAGEIWALITFSNKSKRLLLSLEGGRMVSVPLRQHIPPQP